MTERVTVDFDSESYYLDGEYWESWDNYGEEMADAINKEFNKLEKENEQLKQELFETSKELLWATSDEVDRALHYEEEVEELRKEIFE